MKYKFIALGSLIVIAGCHSKTETVAVAPPVAPPQVENTANVESTPPAPPATPPTPGESTKPTAQAPARPSLDSVPATLKSAAYDYYGLGNTKPVDYELTGDQTAGVRTGALTTSLKEVKDGKASFTQVRSGGLDLLGNDEVSLDAEGVHVTSSTVENFDPKNLEFPSDVTPGKSWKSHDKITQTGLSFEVTSESTVKGVQTIDTKRGKLEALLITSTSEGTENGKKLRMVSETYYVKGIGLAKASIKMTLGSGKPTVLVQQLAD